MCLFTMICGRKPSLRTAKVIKKRLARLTFPARNAQTNKGVTSCDVLSPRAKWRCKVTADFQI